MDSLTLQYAPKIIASFLSELRPVFSLVCGVYLHEPQAAVYQLYC